VNSSDAVRGAVRGPLGEESGPPPTPFERGPAGPLGGPSGARRAPRARLVLLVLVALVVGFAAGFGTALTVTDDDRSLAFELGSRDGAAGPGEPAPGLVALLEGIVASEAIMLEFNEEIAARLEGVADATIALATIAATATDATDRLRGARPGLRDAEGDRDVDAVRSAYLPHLDAWIEYLAALAEEPGLLFTREEQQPYLLLINVTAEAFADALEDLLAEAPSAEVAELAERILDEGFRSERDAAV